MERNRVGRVRVLIAEVGPKLAEVDKSPANQSILKKLEQQVSMNFPNETPLEEVLKYIKSSTTKQGDPPLAVYIDPAGLAEAEKTMASTVTMDLEGVPLKTTLRLLLKQLGLAYCVKDGLLIISTPDDVLDELREYEGRTTSSLTSGSFPREFQRDRRRHGRDGGRVPVKDQPGPAAEGAAALKATPSPGRGGRTAGKQAIPQASGPTLTSVSGSGRPPSRRPLGPWAFRPARLTAGGVPNPERAGRRFDGPGARELMTIRTGSGRRPTGADQRGWDDRPVIRTGRPENGRPGRERLDGETA